MPGSSDLAAVFASARAGNAQAIGKLYHQYSTPILRYCYSLLGDQELAQLCVQEVFIKLWKGIKTFEYRGEQRFTAWLFRSANSEVAKTIRKREATEQVALTVEIGRGGPHALRGTAEVWHDDVLRQALCTLTPEQQEVIALRFLAGMSSSEIAQSLERTEPTVKLLQQLALRHLALRVVAAGSTSGEPSGR